MEKGRVPTTDGEGTATRGTHRALIEHATTSFPAMREQHASSRWLDEPATHTTRGMEKGRVPTTDGEGTATHGTHRALIEHATTSFPAMRE
jgi:hypothetical protein